MSDDLQYQQLLDQYSQNINNPPTPETSPLPDTPPTLPLLDVSNKEIDEPVPDIIEPLKEVKSYDLKETPNSPPVELEDQNISTHESQKTSLSLPSQTSEPTSLPSLGTSYSVPLAAPFNIFKLTFIISLFIFLSVFGFLGYKVFKGDTQFNLSFNQNPKSPVPTSVVPTTEVLLGTCFLNDQQYKIGETFPASDGCNTCKCESDTSINCSEEICQEEVSVVQKTYSHTSPKFQISYPSEWSYYTYQDKPDMFYFELEADINDGEVRPVPENTEPTFVPLTVSIIETSQIPVIIKQLKTDYSYSAYSETKPIINQVKSTEISGQVEAESFITGMIDHHLFIPRGAKTIHLNFIEMDSELNTEVYNQITSSFSW
ncbi:MAG: hypothetical protein WCT01_03095 [Candidatus Shapirobacteria bacterium]